MHDKDSGDLEPNGQSKDLHKSSADLGIFG